MKRSELSAAQLAERERFVRTLVESGWDPGGWEMLFEGDADLSPDAQAELVNAQSELQLGLDLRSDCLRLQCNDLAGNGGVLVVLGPAGGVEPILREVTSRQGALSAATVRPLVEAVRPSCRFVFVEER